jgi:hypothetical protein
VAKVVLFPSRHGFKRNGAVLLLLTFKSNETVINHIPEFRCKLSHVTHSINGNVHVDT